MIVLDTSGLLAAIDASQRHHVAAAKTLRASDGPRLLSPFVLAELDYLLSTRVSAGAAKSQGRSEADLIREGIDVVTSRHQAAEPRLPLFESGQPDLAAHVDEELAGFGER